MSPNPRCNQLALLHLAVSGDHIYLYSHFRCMVDELKINPESRLWAITDSTYGTTILD